MIVDTHTHFYDPSRPQGVPWPSSNDDVLYRTTLPEHYRELAVPMGVSGTVVVEASAWLEDNQWVLDLAADDPFIVGLVGHIDPGTAEFVHYVDRFASHPLFYGIRLGGGYFDDIEQGRFLADMEHLVSRDLELDVLIGVEALGGMCKLAGRLPELRIVINHIASVRIDGQVPDPHWVENMQKAAEHPQVYCKVSGLVEVSQVRPAPDEVGFYTPVLDVLWQAFGKDRLMYGSNWPVSSRFAPYDQIQRIVTAYFAEKGEEATENYFWKNSKSAYKWVERS